MMKLHKGYQKKSGKRSKPYWARIIIDGKCVSLGCYATEEEANIAYLTARMNKCNKGVTKKSEKFKKRFSNDSELILKRR